MTHIINGQFQSDKYPTCPPGKVPLSVEDKLAQDLLWRYAQRRRAVDAEFSADLEAALRTAGYNPIVRESFAENFAKWFGEGVPAEHQQIWESSAIEWAKMFVAEYAAGEAHIRPTGLCEVAFLCAALLHATGNKPY